MFHYQAYGLAIESILPLPEFVGVEAGWTATIRIRRESPVSDFACDGPWSLHVARGEAVLAVREVGVFSVRDGREIVVRPVRGAEDDLLRPYVTGTVMALLLYQRGLLVLHASAVEMEGVAVAFVGQSGAGKSSLAAALCARGHALVADDVTAMVLAGESAMAFPAFPRVKLVPEAAAVLGYGLESSSLLYRDDGKLGCRTTCDFPTRPLPLERVYILGADAAGHHHETASLRSQEAVIELIRHTYPTRLLQPADSTHFLQCAQMARQVDINVLQRVPSVELLPDLAEFVEEHHARSRRRLADNRNHEGTKGTKGHKERVI